jgi:glutamine synthetase
MTKPEKLIFCGISDLAGHFRGKAFPAADLASRAITGMGMPPANILLSAFGPILAMPFGTVGDVALIPDFSTLVDIEADTGTAFVIADIHDAPGHVWACCPRDFLRRAIAGLAGEGMHVLAAFEQEFYVRGLPASCIGSYRLSSLRAVGELGPTLLAALRAAGLTPDSFVAEYAAGQYEVTVAPAMGLRAADDAVITRELIRSTASRLGYDATLAPLLTPAGVGSGTHIHISLQRENGAPVLHDPAGADGLSDVGAAFVAGVATFLPVITALAAPSAASYLRLSPGKWAPTDGTVAIADRGAAIRLCDRPGDAPADRACKFNVEFRVCDATSSPYMALGAVLYAGLEGVRRRMARPPQPTALPQTLGAALDTLGDSAEARGWMGPLLHDVYLQGKRAELAAVDGLDNQAICDRYAAVY